MKKSYALNIPPKNQKSQKLPKEKERPKNLLSHAKRKILIDIKYCK